MFHHKGKDHESMGGHNKMAQKIMTDMVQKQVVEDAVTSQMQGMGGTKQQSVFEEKVLSDEDIDKLLDADDDDFSANYREYRMDNLKHEALKQTHKIVRGEYIEILESEFLDITTKNQFVVLHFYHKDFKNCRLMDTHLREVARTHGETIFGRIDSEKAPFFVVKLAVKTLPTVIIFKDGVVVDRIIGFEDVADNLEFDTIMLTRRLVKSKCVVAKNRVEAGKIAIKKDDDDEEDDMDQ